MTWPVPSSERVAEWIEAADAQDLDWVQEGLLDVVENIIKSKQVPSLEQLTAAMRLPRSTVRQAFIELVKAAPSISEMLRREWPRAYQYIDTWLDKYPALDDAVQFLIHDQDWVGPALMSADDENRLAET